LPSIFLPTCTFTSFDFFVAELCDSHSTFLLLLLLCLVSRHRLGSYFFLGDGASCCFLSHPGTFAPFFPDAVFFAPARRDLYFVSTFSSRSVFILSFGQTFLRRLSCCVLDFHTIDRHPRLLSILVFPLLLGVARLIRSFTGVFGESYSTSSYRSMTRLPSSYKSRALSV